MSAEVKPKRYQPVHVTLHRLSDPERLYRIPLVPATIYAVFAG